MTALETDYLVRVFGTPYGTYIRLPYDRLAELKKILHEHHTAFYVEESRISENGGPYLSYVHLRSGATADTIATLVEHMNANSESNAHAIE